MRLAPVTIVALLALIACSITGSAQPAQHIEPGKGFSLKVGQFAQTRDAALQIGFDGVTADSRCPKGQRCAWAGDATALVWWQHGSGHRQTRELHTAPNFAPAVRVLDHDVRLLRLDPHPVSGKAVSQADYVATLTLGPGAAPER